MTQQYGPKIYVSTIIDSFNYGTVMQAVATNDILARYGEPVFIDYCRPQWTPEGHRELYLRNSGSKLKNEARYWLTLPQWTKQQKMFRRFVQNNLSLCDAMPFLKGGKFDRNAIYCVGSDQTWNYEDNDGLDPVYFLSNVPANCRKIAFAASFGRETLSDDEIEPTRQALSEFDAISVRESSGLTILKDLGLSGQSLIDPVLLCRPNLWKELAGAEAAASKPYVLLYMLNENREMVEYAGEVAKDLGCIVRMVTFGIGQQLRKPHTFISEFQPTPERWLALFRDASYVVTDSFHGTCFSILFEHPMTVFDPPKYSMRIADILDAYDLKSRRVAGGPISSSAEKICHEDIDWHAMRRRSSEFSSKATAFLEECIGENTGL